MNKTPFQARMCRNSLPVVITLLFSACVSDCTNVTATDGGKVILPCNCQNMTSLISWQRDYTIVYNDDRDQTALQYRDRTAILDNSCSLILSQVRASDAGVYTCYYEEKTFFDVYVTLQVTVPDPHVQRPQVFWSVPVVSVVCGSLVLLLIWVSVWIIKRKNRKNEMRENPPELWSLKD
ncbi:hypothetical protein SRHO_G00185470 [Serrasalmus rhombeus]